MRKLKQNDTIFFFDDIGDFGDLVYCGEPQITEPIKKGIIEHVEFACKYYTSNLYRIDFKEIHECNGQVYDEKHTSWRNPLKDNLIEDSNIGFTYEEARDKYFAQVDNMRRIKQNELETLTSKLHEWHNRSLQESKNYKW